jgi:protein-L-isoaspartate(D-aspartate) O-methyltransferase
MMHGMLSKRSRCRFIDTLRELGIVSEDVLNAMYNIPRHLFVDSALSSRSYDQDALPIGFGQSISQPYIVAKMTELLLSSPNKPKKILEIGTGCGYQTAVLLFLGLEVYSIERIGFLLEKARLNLRSCGLTHARLVHGDGQFGLPEAEPFDASIITAAISRSPFEIMRQIQVGGRVVYPYEEENTQFLMSVDITTSGISSHKLEPVCFVPLLDGFL